MVGLWGGGGESHKENVDMCQTQISRAVVPILLRTAQYVTLWVTGLVPREITHIFYKWLPD